MRFVFTAVLWLVLLGGLWLYSSQRKMVQPIVPAAEEIGRQGPVPFFVELTATFDSEADPFSIDTKSSSAPAILRLNGRLIHISAAGLRRGAVLRLKDIMGVVSGYNEIYMAVSPPLSEKELEHGLRLKFFAGERILVDHTAWSGNGAIVSDSVGFVYDKGEEDPGNDRN